MSALLVLGGVVVVLALAVVASYNRFISQEQLIADAWANIDTELRRRYDLVPNLVDTVRAYAAHERSLFEEVARARAAALGSTGRPRTQARDENALVGALRHLLAVSERYPRLRASEHFLALQRELVDTEDRIQLARRVYNANVRDYNRRVKSVPSVVIASIFGFVEEDFFEVEPAVRAEGPPDVAPGLSPTPTLGEEGAGG
ncbi:MAG: LemA family protein [Nitriliruptorales bacterium]